MTQSVSKRGFVQDYAIGDEDCSGQINRRDTTRVVAVRRDIAE